MKLGGKRVFIRVDFNVPLRDGVVQDATRIQTTLPTLRHAIDQSALGWCSHRIWDDPGGNTFPT